MLKPAEAIQIRELFLSHRGYKTTMRFSIDTLGAADPAVRVTWIPDCGCDACDSGSQDVLDELDENVLGVVSGAFRRLWSGDREITVIGDGRWSASGGFRRGEVHAILADPAGWQEVSGAPWTVAG